MKAYVEQLKVEWVIGAKNLMYDIKKYTHTFYDFHSDKHYKIMENQPLLIKDDPTLLFVNSTVALFKNTMKNSEHIEDTALIQGCFRNNSNMKSLIPVYFRMFGHVGMRSSLSKITTNLIELLTNVFHIPSSQLYGVIWHEDKDLEGNWLNFGTRQNIVLQNDSSITKYSTRWTYGKDFPLKGRGMTIVYHDQTQQLCEGEKCDVFCECNRYISLGNIILIQNETTGKEYVETGFGLERVLSIEHDADVFKIPSLRRKLNKLQELGLDSYSSKLLFNIMHGIIVLIEEKVVPGNKKENYILRALIRSLANELTTINKKSEIFNVKIEIRKIFHSLMSEDVFSEANFKVVEQEVDRYLDLIKSSSRIAEKYIRKHSDLEKGMLKKKVMDTYGLPTHIIEQLILKNP
jgi:alanyl-tRNA synthetase